jgi:sortase (surface protein transpeptidase)
MQASKWASNPRKLQPSEPGQRRYDLIIPVIGVRTKIIRLGTTPAGFLQAPATAAVAGWYTGSPPPGAIGSSIIIGHVDSVSGPGVFFRLRLLRTRDLLYVRRADGTLAVFSVDNVHMYAKDHFPATVVYGPTPEAELRLITCGGTFDPQLGSYLSNVVVNAVGVR